MSKHSCVRERLRFSKYEGAGNDFIIIDNRSLQVPPLSAGAIRLLCHRKWGIGADGLALLLPSSKADLRTRIFNCDGSEAETCGNALRCVGRFLQDEFSDIHIELLHKIVEISFAQELVIVNMGSATDLRLHQRIGSMVVHTVNTGVPHAVLFTDDIAKVPIDRLGPFLRHHSAFQPHGVNVNFACLQRDGSFRVRTFERGVEAETLACGSGACGVAAVGAALYSVPFPIAIHCTGGVLQISSIQGCSHMAGPANCVFSGVCKIGDSKIDLG